MHHRDPLRALLHLLGRKGRGLNSVKSLAFVVVGLGFVVPHSLHREVTATHMAWACLVLILPMTGAFLHSYHAVLALLWDPMPLYVVLLAIYFRSRALGAVRSLTGMP
ncbi:MAG: hypothetical protein ACYCW6_29630 [Candidatus Xenobia bacterium]